MGRRDAVQVTLEFVAEWRRLGARVTFEPGWEARGNGMSANYEGAEIHHTAFLSSPGNPFPAKNTLIDGRVDLTGPLCNSAGPWCADDDPWIHVLAAHPANHAGASGGRGTAPFPVTSLFNPLVWGHETDYGGTVPMSAGQRKAALIVGRGVTNVLAKSIDWVKGHAETSISGKWDPGYAPGKTIDMTAFRRDAAAIQGVDMPLTDEDIRRIYDYGVKRVDGRWITLRDFLAWDDAKIDAVKKLVDGRDPVGVDAASLVEGLKPLLAEAVREGMAADNAEQADEIVDRLAARLATGPVS